MKKFMMIIIAAAFVNVVSAQSNQKKGYEQNNNKFENKKNEKQDYKRDNTYAYNSKEKEEKIRQNDWYFEQKIRDVKMNRHLSSFQKNRQVYQLQKQRESEANRIESYYASNNTVHYNSHQSKW